MFEMKICSKCNTEKSFLEFGTNSAAKDGYAYYCKECMKNINKQRYLTPDHSAAKREWHETLRILG